MTKLNVLYVEDEPDIRGIAKMSMETIGGFTICECGSGPEALKAVESYTPDIILLDVMMPGMNGPETLSNLRALPVTANTPVIFMTAKVQSSEINDYIALGALGVIAKPFDPMTLSQQILEMWAKHTGKTHAA